MPKFTSKEGLEINFDPTAKLEVNTRGDRWCKTSFEMFRSWGGKRRINGKPYEGPVYNFLTNNVAVLVHDPAHHTNTQND
jgi:hypothetical protein